MKLEELKEPAKFEPNPFYERLLELRATNPAAFAAISPASKLALLRYEGLRREVLALTDDSLPPAA